MNNELPKYLTLVNWIKDQIINNHLGYGEKFYSENELSAMFKISRQTVRQAISILEQEGIVERRRGSGTYIIYSPNVPKPKTMTIGVISTYIDSYIFPSILKGIERTLSKNSYSMQLAFTYNKIENEKKALLSMLDNKVDGLIVEPTKSVLPNPNMSLYKEIEKKNIPLLFFHAYYTDLNFPHVTMDDKLAGKIATEYLLKAGHEKIAGIFQMDDLQGHMRYSGYLEALRTAGIELNANRVLWYSTEDLTHLKDDMKRILRYVDGCTGIVCYNDQVAYTLISELDNCNIKVPEELSVVGIDNSDLSILSKPEITSVEHPMDKLGKKAAENLLKLINDPGYNATYEFRTRIIERNSVRKL